MTSGPFLNMGGDFDRCLRWSLWKLTVDALDGLGWLGTSVEEGGARVHRPVTVRAGPGGPGGPVRVDAGAFNGSTVEVGDEFEVGSHVTGVRQPFAFDIYAESDTIGRMLRGDLLAVLAGRAPAVGRTENVLPVLDGSQAPPPVLVYADIEDLFGGQASGFDDQWRRHWFSVEGVLDVPPYAEVTP